jgi:hypothetical protein
LTIALAAALPPAGFEPGAPADELGFGASAEAITRSAACPAAVGAAGFGCMDRFGAGQKAAATWTGAKRVGSSPDVRPTRSSRDSPRRLFGVSKRLPWGRVLALEALLERVGA